MSTDNEKLGETLAGKFLVLDGPDGCGKSTQCRLLADHLEAGGVNVLTCRDPGGTPIGDRIRSVLLDDDLNKMDVTCETLLFMASRAQLLAKIIRPALRDGKTVICDRFVTSTCAYQGAAGFDPRRVIELARFAIGEDWPDLTILLDVNAEEGFKRIGRKPHHAGKNREKAAKRAPSDAMLFEDSQPDAMEARSIDFHRRVRRLYLDVHAYYPKPVIVVDGRGAVDLVHQRVREVLADVAW